MSQIKDGDNPISLILVETLMGLDVVFHGRETQNFLESPLTLQIWLMERLDMIAKPTTGNYGPSSFLSRAVIKTKCQTGLLFRFVYRHGIFRLLRPKRNGINNIKSNLIT